MYNIAIIGDRDSIIGFQLLGISVFPVTDKEETVNILNKLVEEKYATVFITENIASQIFDKIEELQKGYLTGITIIPNKLEKMNLGEKLLKKNIKKAIGTEILFRKEGE